MFLYNADTEHLHHIRSIHYTSVGPRCGDETHFLVRHIAQMSIKTTPTHPPLHTQQNHTMDLVKRNQHTQQLDTAMVFKAYKQKHNRHNLW